MHNNPTAAFIIIGNEVLSGRTQDKNLAYLAGKLCARGINLCEVRVVRDDVQAIIQAVRMLSAHFDLVFTSGGIGPTHDDITARSVADCFGVPLVRHPDAVSALKEHYKGGNDYNAARAKMADIPAGSRLIPNPSSAAPGFIIENVHVCAGVPSIFRAMVDWVMPQLAGGAVVLSQTVHIDSREGDIAEQLTAIQRDFPETDIGSYPHFHNGTVGVSIVVRGTNEKVVTKAANAVKQSL